MNTYKIAVVEDEKEQIENLKNLLQEYALRNDLSFDITAYLSGEEFLPVAGSYDLAFLDIDLSGSRNGKIFEPEQKILGSKTKAPAPSQKSDAAPAPKNGMAIAADARARGITVPIVFVTNLVMYAVDGYSVGALDFIVKPVAYESLSIKMDRIVKKAFRSKNAVTLRVGTTIRKIPVDTIKYVEVRGHKLTVHSLDGNYDAYVPLNSVMSELDGCNFIRCNVCYLVNLGFVTGVDGNTVYLGNESVTVSRSKKKEFLTALNRFLGGNL